MADRNFIKGYFKKKEFNNGGHIINLAMKLEELTKIVDDKGYVRVILSELKTPTEYCTHYMYEDDYMKNKNKDTKPVPESDLPF